MCGITGALHLRADVPAQRLGDLATAMADTLRHRGPDAGGVWTDPDVGLALGHRRLSIIDLSEDGAQPMVSADGRWVCTYNGEVYNHGKLRARLEQQGHRFRGHSDTEVLVEAVAAWGLEPALEQLDGMFGIGLWDRRERRLHLVRDRIGEKPLYVGWFGDVLLFGSELRPLRAHPDFDGAVDRDAVAQLLKRKYVPAPLSIHRAVRKVEPGTIVTIDVAAGPGALRVTRYWSALETVLAGLADPVDAGPQEVADELEGLLRGAVTRRMVADVPLGAFLSGGIDSSTVVALMQQASPTPVRTFTIGVESEAYDEASHAAAVAAHLGTDHTELYVTERQVRDVVPRLPQLYDEPFADSSQVPVALVSELARRDVTVALSGDGGDELFAGYNRHVFGPRALSLSRRLPAGTDRLAGAALTGVAPATWDRAARVAGRLHPSLRHRLPGEKLHKLGRALPADGPADLYDRLRAHWYRPQDVVPGAQDRTPQLPEELADRGFAEQAMYLDLVDYLPGDILTKVDRAAMAVGLETRIPLLAPEVVEFAWRVPLAAKVVDGVGKAPLRRVLARHVPRELFERPKAGFGVPVDEWLRGPLKGWARDLLTAPALDDLLTRESRDRVWRDHQAGRANLQYQLWDVLMLSAWLTEQAG